MPVVYSCDDELEDSRDPTNYMIDDPDDPQPVDGWILPLSYGGRYGVTVLLDAREGERHQISFSIIFGDLLSFSVSKIILSERSLPSMLRL